MVTQSLEPGAHLLNARAIRVELEFRNVGFCGEGKTGVPGEKPLGAEKRTNDKLNPHMTSSPEIEPGPHGWKASAPHHCAIPAPPSSNNSQGDDFFFCSKRGRLFEGGDYFKYCSLEVAPGIFCSIFPLNPINKYTEHVPNLVPWLLFNVNVLGVRAWRVTDQFCWIRLHVSEYTRSLLLWVSLAVNL